MGENIDLGAKLYAPIPHVSTNGVLAGPSSVATPPDDEPVDQDPGYEEADDLDPDTTLADPDVQVETLPSGGDAA